MLLNTYEQNGRLFNMNFIEEAGAGLAGYRGELVLVEGEVADAAGRRKPPVAVIEQAVMLAGTDKIQMISGLVHELAELEHFFSGYAADVDTAVTPLFFVVNAAKEMKVTMNGVTADIIPLPAGLVWTELCDLLGLERPSWAHVPLVLGPDGARLAKRHGAVTLRDLASERGWEPADAVSWMARSLGMAEEGERVSAAELIEHFDPEVLPRQPTTFP